MPGVYAGGDVANDGPATIVKAAAAGKAIADSILNAHGTAPKERAGPIRVPIAEMAEMLRRRSHRERRVRGAAYER